MSMCGCFSKQINKPTTWGLIDEPIFRDEMG